MLYSPGGTWCQASCIQIADRSAGASACNYVTAKAHAVAIQPIIHALSASGLDTAKAILACQSKQNAHSMKFDAASKVASNPLADNACVIGYVGIALLLAYDTAAGCCPSQPKCRVTKTLLYTSASVTSRFSDQHGLAFQTNSLGVRECPGWGCELLPAATLENCT